MFFIMLLRAAAGRNSDGSTELPCSSIMRTSRSYIFTESLRKPAIGSCASRNRSSINAAFRCFTQMASNSRCLVSSSALSSRNDVLPPATLPSLWALTVAAMNSSRLLNTSFTAQAPTVQVMCVELSPTSKVNFAMWSHTCLPQVCASRAEPRSSRTMIDVPSKRPATSRGCRRLRISSASCARISSECRMPTLSITAPKLSGLI